MRTKEGICGILLAVVLIFSSVFPQTGLFLQGAAKIAIVKNQQELDKALKNKMLSTIKIKSSTGEIKIPKGNYNKVKLEVNAAKARIENSGQFNNITIKNAETYTEKASGNSVELKDSELKLNVKKMANVAKIYSSKNKAKIQITVAGKVEEMEITGKNSSIKTKVKGMVNRLKAAANASKIQITGSTKETIPVEIAADDVKLTTAVTSDIKISAKASIVFKKGSEKSTVCSEVEEGDIKIINKTDKKIDISYGNVKSYEEIYEGLSLLYSDLIEVQNMTLMGKNVLEWDYDSIIKYVEENGVYQPVPPEMSNSSTMVYISDLDGSISVFQGGIDEVYISDNLYNKTGFAYSDVANSAVVLYPKGEGCLLPTCYTSFSEYLKHYNLTVEDINSLFENDYEDKLNYSIDRQYNPNGTVTLVMTSRRMDSGVFLDYLEISQRSDELCSDLYITARDDLNKSRVSFSYMKDYGWDGVVMTGKNDFGE